MGFPHEVSCRTGDPLTINKRSDFECITTYSITPSIGDEDESELTLGYWSIAFPSWPAYGLFFGVSLSWSESASPLRCQLAERNLMFLILCPSSPRTRLMILNARKVVIRHFQPIFGDIMPRASAVSHVTHASFWVWLSHHLHKYMGSITKSYSLVSFDLMTAPNLCKSQSYFQTPTGLTGIGRMLPMFPSFLPCHEAWDLWRPKMCHAFIILGCVDRFVLQLTL